MTDRCGDRERHGIDQQFRAGVQVSYFMEAADAGDRGEELFGHADQVQQRCGRDHRHDATDTQRDLHRKPV